MNIYLPSNIFSGIFGMLLPDSYKSGIQIIPSSLIAKKLEEEPDSVGIMPSMELLKLPGMFVSGKVAISFDGALSNSYLYFVPEQNKFDKILVRGDVSTNEIILSKILFKERFDLNPEIILDTEEINFEESNYLIAGQENNDYVVKNNGVSFSDQIAEFINFPYVNYVLASQNADIIEQVVTALGNIDDKIMDNIFSLLEKIDLAPDLLNFISENIDTIYFELTDNEKEGLVELLQLPYYHGIVNEMVEVKYA